MECAGILLTGGRSRRMGRDKATIRLAGGPTLATRTAALLAGATARAVEVGPSRTTLPAVGEDPPASGPLAATVAGWSALTSGGWAGPVLVVATDLPSLTSGMLCWLAGHPAERSIVPVAAGRVQPLCARYSAADMAIAAGLVAAGARAMSALLEASEPLLAGEELWAGPAGGAGVLTDVDTPHDLHLLAGP